MLARLKLYSDFVMLKHTLFAIPFAYLGAFLASGGIPDLHILLWVGLAFLGARSAAMTVNNLVDKDIDGRNPRTSSRELPSGKITLKEAWAIIIVSYFLLFFSSYQLNWLCFLLAPIIPITSIAYPYFKRFSPVSHFVLGLNLGYAPVGGWLAVAGKINFPFGSSEFAMLILLLAVTLWVAGFDIIYSLLDFEFDKKEGLYSVPTFFGIKKALTFSFVSHILMLLLLIGLMYVLDLGMIFKIGLLVITALILYEHNLVRADDFEHIPMAFFNVNAAVSLSILVFTVMDVIVTIT